MHVATRKLRVILAGMLVAVATVSATVGATATTPQAVTVPTLVGIRAGHHPGYDRIVFIFDGGLPAHRSARWVSTVVEDGSGRIDHVAGHAYLQTVFHTASAHTATGASTIQRRITYRWPNITQTLMNGDFEGYVSVAIGLQRHTSVLRFFTLSSPSRVVIDVSTAYPWTTRKVFYLDADRYATGTQPYTIGVPRPVIPPTVARNALERLFAGTTRAEHGAGLRFVRSEAKGFTNLSIANGVARVQLTGGCASHGATYTIANEIFPTLKQFPTVDHVKLYGPLGYTENPNGPGDSIPPCLEP